MLAGVIIALIMIIIFLLGSLFGHGIVIKHYPGFAEEDLPKEGQYNDASQYMDPEVKKWYDLKSRDEGSEE